jgi:hypothetical protein
MRFLAVFSLIGALLAAGCEAPARDPGAARTPSASPPAQAIAPPAGLQDAPAVPPGLPAAGIDPRQAAADQRHDVWVVGTGTVERLLRDDTKAPRHQRFVVRIDERLTLLFAHNIDVAPRVPFKRGDRIAFRGQYVWNPQGGVVHWTHRSRGDRKAGGWIVWNGQNFR